VSLPGDRLAVGYYDRTIGVWSLETRKEIVTLQGRRHPILDKNHLDADKVSALALLSDGRLATGLWTGPIQLWDLSIDDNATDLRGHTGVVWTLTILPDGTLASGSSDKTIRLWDCMSGTELRRLDGHGSAVRAVAALPDGRLASASFDKTIRLWDLKSGTEVDRLEGHTHHVTALAVISDAILASGSADKTIRLWDVQTSDEVHCFRLGAAVLSLAAIPGGRLVAGVAREQPNGRVQWLEVVGETH
jgi:WD40 repeat protein